MKIILALSFLSSMALAQVSTKSVYTCSYWSYNTAVSGYVCGSYPTSDQVVDAYSLNQKISNLESRIQKLEAKLLEVTNK
ncbi:MAG: hypothetical protein WA160_10155 [Pseudobdellovibrio sp.]